jgi:hypothetical protein
MTCSTFGNPVSCENRFVIRFLDAWNMSGTKIHRELCAAELKYED